MSKAICYIDQKSLEKSDDTNNTIPKQAINIPIGKVLDKAILLTNLAKACHFPDYFAHNWDSAWDCLTDSEVTHLQLCLTDVEQINNADLNIFKSMIEDAYKDFGKPQLWIVVSGKDK